MDDNDKKEIFGQEFAKRLSEAFEFATKAQGRIVSAREVASAVGISEASIRKYLGGSIPSAEIASKLARELNVYTGWLIAGEGVDPNEGWENNIAELINKSDAYDQYKSSGITRVPHLDVQASAGPGLVTQQEDQIGEVGFDDRWLRHIGMTSPAHARVITANGQSNEPLIRHGDMLLVDTGIKEIGDTHFYVILQNGDLRVKLCTQRHDGVVTIRSHNKDFDDKEEIANSEVDDLHVCGLVRWFGRAIA